MSMKTVIVALLVSAISLNVFAGTLQEKGMATVPYSGWSGVVAKVRATAMTKAKINAVERYIANTSAAEQRNYDAVRSKIIAHIDRYVLSSSILSASKDKEAKTYTIVISADLNISRLDNALQANTAVSNTSQSQRSYITFIFVAREQSNIKTFNNEIVKRHNITTSKNGAATKAQTDTRKADASRAKHDRSATNVSENGIDTQAQLNGKEAYASETNHNRRAASVSDSRSNEGTQTNTKMAYTSALHATAVNVTGGSVTRRADDITYRVTRSNIINDVISNALSQAGYKVVDAAFLAQRTHGLLSIRAFEHDFGQGNDISARTLANAAQAVQESHVSYLAYGTLDVGIQDTDPTTGLTRVYVDVTAKVYDLTGLFPITVAAVGPMQYAGLGPNAAVARINALKLAAGKAATRLVAEMDAKGIK